MPSLQCVPLLDSFNASLWFALRVSSSFMTGMVGFITLASWVLREAYESYSQLGGGFKKKSLIIFQSFRREGEDKWCAWCEDIRTDLTLPKESFRLINWPSKELEISVAWHLHRFGCFSEGRLQCLDVGEMWGLEGTNAVIFIEPNVDIKLASSLNEDKQNKHNLIPKYSQYQYHPKNHWLCRWYVFSFNGLWLEIFFSWFILIHSTGISEYSTVWIAKPFFPCYFGSAKKPMKKPSFEWTSKNHPHEKNKFWVWHHPMVKTMLNSSWSRLTSRCVFFGRSFAAYLVPLHVTDTPSR